MKNRARTLLLAVVAEVSLLGCASYPGTARAASFDELREEEGWLLLDSVPFVRQVSDKGCGAACLAMVLGHRGGGRIAALDPARGLVCDSLVGFEGEWTPTNGVTLVVFLPEDGPAPTGSDAGQEGGGS